MAGKKVFLFIVLSLVFVAAVFADFAGDGNPVITGTHSGRILGSVNTINQPDSVTISGDSRYGSYYTMIAKSPLGISGTTYTLESSTGSGENVVFYLSSDTAQSGTTMWISFDPVDIVSSEVTCWAGTSSYYISGATGAGTVVAIGSAVSRWHVFVSGTVTVQDD